MIPFTHHLPSSVLATWQHWLTSKHSGVNSDAMCISTPTHTFQMIDMLYTQAHTFNRMHTVQADSPHTSSSLFSALGVSLTTVHMHIFTRLSAQESGCSKVDWQIKQEERELGDSLRCPVHAVSIRSSQESAESHGISACRRRRRGLAPGAAAAACRPAWPPVGRPGRRVGAGSRSACPRRRTTGKRRPAAAAKGAEWPRVRRARASPAPPSVPMAAPACVRCVPTLTRSRCPG